MAHPMQHYGERKLKKKFPMHEGVQDFPKTDLRELVDNLYGWLYIVLNRLDQIENPGMEPQWPDPRYQEPEVRDEV